jgi:predicted RNA-binding Zn-ribbon protein involved in translation (DUF1610 family)
MTNIIFDCPSCGASMEPEKIKIGFKYTDENREDVEYSVRVVCKECGFAPKIDNV